MSTRSKSNHTRHASRARSHVDPSSDGLAHLSTHVTNRIKEVSDQVRQAADDRIEQVRDQATSYMKKGRRKATQLERRIEKQIAGRPIASLLAAAACGCVAGFMLSRR